METLKVELMKNGFKYKQIKRTKHAAMYRAYLKEGKDWTPSSFEVFKIKIRKAGFCMGSPTPETEIFPSNEAFGKFAWSIGGHGCEERAEKLFDEIKHGEKKKNKLETKFGEYTIIKYLNKDNNVMVLKNGKLYNKPKDVLIQWVVQFCGRDQIDAKNYTTKELGRLIFR